MKINYVGVVAGVMVFVSLALPWWTMVMSAEVLGVSFAADVSVYPYQAKATVMEPSQAVSIELWFGWVALALVATAGVTGIAGSLIAGRTGRTILAVAGVLTLLSVSIFAMGLRNELSEAPLLTGFPVVDLFSSGSYSFMGVTMDYSSRLTFGFWLALIAAITAFVSLPKHQA